MHLSRSDATADLVSNVEFHQSSASIHSGQVFDSEVSLVEFFLFLHFCIKTEKLGVIPFC